VIAQKAADLEWRVAVVAKATAVAVDVVDEVAVVARSVAVVLEMRIISVNLQKTSLDPDSALIDLGALALNSIPSSKLTLCKFKSGIIPSFH